MPMVATDRFVLRGIAVLLFCPRPVGSLLRGEGSTAGPFHYETWLHCSKLPLIRSPPRQRGRRSEAERLCGLDVYNHLELDALLDRKVNRLCACKNLSDIDP